jgi:hypothetical protein
MRKKERKMAMEGIDEICSQVKGGIEGTTPIQNE